MLADLVQHTDKVTLLSVHVLGKDINQILPTPAINCRRKFHFLSLAGNQSITKTIVIPKVEVKLLWSLVISNSCRPETPLFVTLHRTMKQNIDLERVRECDRSDSTSIPL